jgi:hypothetical protein
VGLRTDGTEGKEETMGRSKRTVMASAMAMVTATGLVFAGIASAGAQGEPIRVSIPAGVGGLLDHDSDGRIDRGDRFIGRSRLEDPATGENAGRVLFDCLATTSIVIEQQKGTWMCTYVLELPEGHINLQGEDPAGVGSHVFAVTGGTGVYRNARGEADEVDTEVAEEITIHLEP